MGEIHPLESDIPGAMIFVCGKWSAAIFSTSDGFLSRCTSSKTTLFPLRPSRNPSGSSIILLTLGNPQSKYSIFMSDLQRNVLPSLLTPESQITERCFQSLSILLIQNFLATMRKYNNPSRPAAATKHEFLERPI